MPFPEPPATSITLPTGATSGARSVIDGATDTITVYDANNVAVITITASFPGIGFGTGPTILFNPDTFGPSPWTRPGFLTGGYNGSVGGVTLAAPSVDPATDNQATLSLDSGTVAGSGNDSVAAITTGPQGTIVFESGAVVLHTHTDKFPRAIGSDNQLHNVAVGEWHTVQVTVAAGATSGTTVLSFDYAYSANPKVIGFINSGFGAAIRATAFCSAKTPADATIRVDTNAALGAATTFGVDVLVLSA